eukprot:jgi/Undpi1/10494/HiC_scaffold_29.g12944.m1
MVWAQVLRVFAGLSRLPSSAATNGTRQAQALPRVLHPGCGSSQLGVVLKRDHGFKVVNADFSEGIMEKMRSRFPDCEFVRSDARNAGFPSGSFDLAVDKGLFDCVTAVAQGREEAAREFLGEAARVLAPGGKYVMFSAFSNDGMGHKDMKEILSHPGFADVKRPGYHANAGLSVGGRAAGGVGREGGEA